MRHFPPAQRTATTYTQYCPRSSLTLTINEVRGAEKRRDVKLVVQGRGASKDDIRLLQKALAGFSGIKGVSALCGDKDPVALQIVPFDENVTPVEVRFSGGKVLDIH